MSYLGGAFVDASTGKAVNGATAKLWQLAAFSTPPAKNTALPDVGFQVGSAVTTGTAHGSDGAYLFESVANANYWVSIEYNGNIGWQHALVLDNAGSDHGLFSGLDDDDHPQYTRKTLGGKETVSTVAASGATETLTLVDGNVHDVTLTADCTFTFTGATAGTACSFVLLLRQDIVGSRVVFWPGSVLWPGGNAPILSTAASSVDVVTFISNDGGTTWYGSWADVADFSALPLGVLGYAQKTATNQTGITTLADLTGLSIAVTVAASRRIRVSAELFLSSSVGTDRLGFSIREGSTELQLWRDIPSQLSTVMKAQASVVLTPSEGAHTYKLSAELVQGTGTVTAAWGTDFPAYILVEDIGPA